MTEMIPAVVFAYRRPDLLRRALDSLRANLVPKIYAFSDGPRESAAAADVAEVRRMLHAVDWAPIEIIESPTNLGVAEAEIGGISRVLAQHEMAVMIEEDLEFGPGTYDFVCAGLRHYRNEPRVMGVTAWTHARVSPRGVTQPYFTGRMSGLMWGTWRRAWEGMRDANAAQRLAECRAQGIDPSVYGRDLVESVVHEEERGFWDLRFNLHMLARGGLFLFPARSMVRHIGYDSRATNSPDGTGWENEPVPPPRPDSLVWPAVEETRAAAARWRDAIGTGRPTIAGRLRRRLRKMRGR
jgi:hypothetical protein